MDLNCIKIFAKQKHITIKELSEKIGMSERGLHKSIKNNSISAEYLEKIANVLDISISNFFDTDNRAEVNSYLNFIKSICQTDKNDIIKDYTIFIEKLPKFNDVTDFYKQLNDIEKEVRIFINDMRIKYPIIKILTDNAQIMEDDKFELCTVFYDELFNIIEMSLYSDDKRIDSVIRPLLLSHDAEYEYMRQIVEQSMESERLKWQKELLQRVLKRVQNMTDNKNINSKLINKIVDEEVAEMNKFTITPEDFKDYKGG